MKPQLKYGLIAGILMIAITLIEYKMGEDSAAGNAIGWLKYVVLAIAIVLALKEARDRRGYLTYGQGLGLGTLTSFIGGLTTVIVEYIYLKFINHGIISAMQMKADEEITKRLADSSTTEQQMQVAGKFSKIMLSPGGMAFFTLLGIVFFGFILSLIIAAILKRDEPINTGYTDNNPNTVA